MAILKNFAGFDNKLLIEPGNVLSRYTSGSVFVKATVKDVFPVQICLYDLTNFISVANLFPTAEFYFQDHFVRIRDQDGHGEVRYLYAPPSLVQTRVPKALSNPPSERIEFYLPEEQWAAIQKAASVLRKTAVRIAADANGVRITTFDQTQPNPHEFSTVLSAERQKHCCNMIFELGNLKLLPGSYRIMITPNYAVFDHISGFSLTYWIGCDPKSTFR